MKLLRVGNKGKEKPAVLEANGKFRDLSSAIKDLTPDNLTHSTIEKLKGLDLESLPELSNSERIGSCISKIYNEDALVKIATENGRKIIGL